MEQVNQVSKKAAGENGLGTNSGTVRIRKQYEKKAAAVLNKLELKPRF